MCMAECPSARKTPKAGKLSGPARARIISLRRFSFSGQNELPRYCPDKITPLGQAADTTKGGDFRCPHRSARGCDGSVRQKPMAQVVRRKSPNEICCHRCRCARALRDGGLSLEERNWKQSAATIPIRCQPLRRIGSILMKRLTRAIRWGLFLRVLPRILCGQWRGDCRCRGESRQSAPF